MAVGLAEIALLALLFGVLPRWAAAKLQNSRAADPEAGAGAQSATRSRLSVCICDAQYLVRIVLDGPQQELDWSVHSLSTLPVTEHPYMEALEPSLMQ